MKIIIPSNKKGLDYCGSKRIRLDDELSIEDARLIVKESPSFGIQIIEDKPKPKKKRGDGKEEEKGV
jgi:hypothetical protein